VTAVPHPAEIDVEHAIERLGIGLLDDCRRVADAGVVDQCVEAVFLGRGLDEVRERIGVAHVEFVERGVAVGRFDPIDGLLATFAVDVGHDHPRALRGTALGGRTADSRACTRHEHRSVLESHGRSPQPDGINPPGRGRTIVTFGWTVGDKKYDGSESTPTGRRKNEPRCRPSGRMAADQPLVDHAAIVTGASSGIGSATAHALARDGADLALAARREERLEELAAELEADHGVATLVAPTDVTEEDAVAELIDGTVDAFGSLDVLVNNAGLARGADVETLSTEEYRTMMDVNVDGSFFATRAALPHLRASEGNLIFVGSFAGQYPRPFNPVYAATKWWVRGFAHSVAGAVGEAGVGVTVVNPSEVRTEFGDDESFAERFDQGEVTEPDEIADAIAFAARQDRSTVSELDLFRRDKFSDF
jgi:NADP-dependent 3-hydroxy acid dehydrogenase YdfG